MHNSLEHGILLPWCVDVHGIICTTSLWREKNLIRSAIWCLSLLEDNIPMWICPLHLRCEVLLSTKYWWKYMQLDIILFIFVWNFFCAAKLVHMRKTWSYLTLHLIYYLPSPFFLCIILQVVWISRSGLCGQQNRLPRRRLLLFVFTFDLILFRKILTGTKKSSNSNEAHG